MDKSTPEPQYRDHFRPRGPDRRICTHIYPPPYQTRDGVVMADRRSAIDRRATWIREYSLETLLAYANSAGKTGENN